MARSDSHPGTIDRHGPSWRWRVMVAGDFRTYYLPRDGDTELPAEPVKEDVEDFARREHKQLKKELEKNQGGAIHFSELLARFVKRFVPGLAEGSQTIYKRAVERFRLFFVENGSDPLVRQMDTDDCAEYLSWRRMHSHDGSERGKPLSGNTLKKDRSVLSKIFSKAIDWDQRDTNPVSGTDSPRTDERDPVILTDEQYEGLLAEANASKNPMLARYVLLLGETGVRSDSEGPWIRWEDVDLQEGFLWVKTGRDGHRTKGGEGRWVPLTPRIRDALREHAARYRLRTYDGKRSPWIFHHEFAFKDVKPGDRMANMRHAFANACERANLPEEFRKHDLRHRRVTTWLAAGHSPVKVQKAMGHSDLKTTMRYYRFVRSHLKSLVEPNAGEIQDVSELTP